MRIDIPDDKKLVHEAIIPLRWGDMDAFGHINNTLYFRYMEQGRIHWIESFGFGIQHSEGGALIANAFCNFYTLRQGYSTPVTPTAWGCLTNA